MTAHDDHTKTTLDVDDYTVKLCHRCNAIICDGETFEEQEDGSFAPTSTPTGVTCTVCHDGDARHLIGDDGKEMNNIERPWVVIDEIVCESCRDKFDMLEGMDE